MKVRICIIGNGEFANKVHLPSLCSFNDVEIFGIIAFNKERLQQTAQRFNINPGNVYAVSSPVAYRQVLQQLRPDGVYSIGQPDAMMESWFWCLQNGFHLYIEKPLGLNLHQAEMLAYLADKNKRITQVSFQRRSSPILQAMKAACKQRGPIVQAQVEFGKYIIGPMLGARDRMRDDFIHCIDTARWIGEGEIVKIDSHCRRIQTPDINNISATLYFDNGTVCHTLGNWTSGRRVFRVSMYAPGINADVEPEKEAFLYRDGKYEGERFDAKAIAGSDELFVYGGFQQKNREFIDSIRTGTDTTSSPFRDALKTMQVCETILAQSLLA